ncbi:MAG: hypothetical protein JOS17DRAFT_601730 [Linnemannia elongata]|nr:MAG: hypothetical protein JOS17DRAFT_601730 [Linnemannia elongata]
MHGTVSGNNDGSSSLTLHRVDWRKSHLSKLNLLFVVCSLVVCSLPIFYAYRNHPSLAALLCSIAVLDLLLFLRCTPPTSNQSIGLFSVCTLRSCGDVLPRSTEYK